MMNALKHANANETSGKESRKNVGCMYNVRLIAKYLHGRQTPPNLGNLSLWRHGSKSLMNHVDVVCFITKHSITSN